MGETQNQQTEPQLKAKELLDKMAPEERVGQLFLVNLKGRDITEKSQIYDLIAKHNIGGVILSNANDNFFRQNKLTSNTNSDANVNLANVAEFTNLASFVYSRKGK